MPHPRDDQLNRPPRPDRRKPNETADAADRTADESRSFDADTPPGGHMGPAGDPAEGKRD
jgi:hypothetical protein